MLRMFRGQELLKIGKRLDQVAKEKREDAAAPRPEDRLARVEAQNDALRQALRMAKSST
jgi:hypothetical protein